ncbi:MAG: cytochrome c [Bacteroidota bacterium]
MKALRFLTIIGVVSLIFYSFDFQDPEEWDIPEKYLKMTNPTDPTVDLDIGKSLYNKHCKSCHGKEGYGDGPKADEVEGNLGDFSTAEFHAQPEGAIFYKSYIGRNDMPNYEKKIPDEEDMWLVINYMKTMLEE